MTGSEKLASDFTTAPTLVPWNRCSSEPRLSPARTQVDVRDRGTPQGPFGSATRRRRPISRRRSPPSCFLRCEPHESSREIEEIFLPWSHHAKSSHARQRRLRRPPLKNRTKPPAREFVFSFPRPADRRG